VISRSSRGWVVGMRDVMRSASYCSPVLAVRALGGVVVGA